MDGLGRPNVEPDLDGLAGCATDRLDQQVLEAFLVRQFSEGPSAYLTPEGQAFLDESQSVIVDCADELGISHQPPN
ncbi:MAG: hypothetical protein RJA49_463, partial [Actinomycetota bacterium]